MFDNIRASSDPVVIGIYRDVMELRGITDEQMKELGGRIRNLDSRQMYELIFTLIGNAIMNNVLAAGDTPAFKKMLAELQSAEAKRERNPAYG